MYKLYAWFLLFIAGYFVGRAISIFQSEAYSEGFDKGRIVNPNLQRLQQEIDEADAIAMR